MPVCSPRSPLLLCALVGVLAAACDRDKPVAPASEASGAASADQPAAAPAQAERYEILPRLETCEVRYRGVLVDLGTRAGRAHAGFKVEPIEDVVDAEREGATVAKITASKIGFQLVTDEPLEEISLVMRVHGGAARSVSAVLGDRRLGTLRLAAGETRQLEFPLLKAELPAGRHNLSLTFRGRPRGNNDPVAEIDWIRLGPKDEAVDTYAAPTLRDIETDAVLDGVPRRALALRAPAAVRCPMMVAKDAVLRTDLGFWGDGKGSIDVRVLADGEQPEVLAERRVAGGGSATWSRLEVPLGGHASRVVALELRALEATRGGRVLFGDPALVRTEAKESVPKAKTVVLVIASALDRRSIPPWGEKQGLSNLGLIARSSAVFTSYRVPTTVPPAVVASLLTGLAPGVHALEDPAARLPTQARMLGKLVKEASGRTAMFTSVPTTAAPFGFDAGWDRFEAVSPVEDVPAAAPIVNAAKWLDAELAEGDSGRHLVVIHTRGGHPPWDVSKEEAARLPPEDYAGVLDPRRGGIVLGKLRTTKRRSVKRLTDEDWTRHRALVHASLLKQDEALGQLLSVLKKKGAWDSSLIMIVGDVSPGDPPDLPYDPAGELSESRLLVPLLVKFPGARLAAKEVATAVTSTDISATVLAALGLKGPPGLDLYAVGRGVQPLAGRGLVATLGDHYSTRLGHWLLEGVIGKPPKLCQLDVDPACVNDVFSEKPIAGWAAWQWTYDAFDEATRQRVAPREPASIDPDTGAALTVWGDI